MSQKWIETRKRAWHHLALLECQMAQNGPRPEGIWINLKHILFDFLKIKTRPSSYSDYLAIFLSLPTSINSGWISKFGTLFQALRFPLFLILFFSLLH